MRPHLIAWIWVLILWGRVASAQPALDVKPPPPPAVPPLISETYPTDQDGDHLEDQLLAKVLETHALTTLAATAEDRAKAQAQLGEMVEVELIFRRQITQGQLDAFRALGGEITHVYRADSYGWNGRLPLGQVLALTPTLGGNLLHVSEAKQVQMHIDVATQTGRVRPIWAGGFAGNPSGFQGDTNITIAIVDSGMDETHPDLNGRRVCRRDFTTNNAASPIDMEGHRPHVAGIALGARGAAEMQ